MKISKFKRTLAFIKFMYYQTFILWYEFNKNIDSVLKANEQILNQEETVNKVFLPCEWHIDKITNLKKIAKLFREGNQNNNPSDIQLCIEWLTSICGSNLDAKTSLLILSLIDFIDGNKDVKTQKHYICDNTYWDLEIIQPEIIPQNKMALIHVHGNVTLDGNELMNLCANMRVVDFENAKPVKEIMCAITDLYHKISKSDKPALINWAYVMQEKIA